MAYNFKEIEKKWQDKWDKEGTFNAKDDYTMKKWYGLIEFPYPSGQGLHVGHPRSYTALDIIARKRRLQGYNVLFPIGFDAFGLPAENYAIKTNVHPKITTAQNIAHFTEQLKSLGFSFDWSRKIDTTDPEYYKWTQWIFIQLYKHGLAYKTTMPINFCTGCKVGLANEEVVNGVCERCGSPVVQKEKSEWMLKITAYAQKLIDDYTNYMISFREKYQNNVSPRVLILMGLPGGSYVVATESSYVGDLVRLAGGTNIYGDGEGKDFVNVSVEDMLKQNPDIILRTSHAMPKQVMEYFQQEFSNNQTWQQFDAVKNNKVYDLNNEYFGMSANFNYQKGLEDLEGILYENN